MSTLSTQPDTWDEGFVKPPWLAETIKEEDVEQSTPASVPVIPPIRVESPQLKGDGDISQTHSETHPPLELPIKPTGPPKPDEDKPIEPETGRPNVGGREEGWGTPFKVKWIRTDSLPFTRTRHLRNPWNHDVCTNLIYYKRL